MVETVSDSGYQKGQLYTLELAHLQTDPNQPRKSLDPQALEELAASIKEHGVLQPILFRADFQTESLYVVAGERRCAAAQQAGLTTIPGIFVDGNTAEIALVENLLRLDLTAIEEAEALQRLKLEQQYTDEQLSGVIGKARTTISDIMLINRLPEAIRDECREDRKISKSTLIEIARKKQERGMMTAYNAYKVKQQKAKATRQKKDPNDPRAHFDMMDKAMTKIGTIDTSAWAEEDKVSYLAALTNLKAAIDTCLGGVAGGFDKVPIRAGG